MQKLLEIKNLSIEYHREEKTILARTGVNLAIGQGEILGLAGESGCGKSTIALSIMRLIPTKQGRISGGQIIFNGQDILPLNEDEMRQIRGNKIGMVFQEAFSSLNPVFKVGEQIREAIKLHHPELANKESKQKAIESLQKVNIPNPEERYHSYPHQLSGGMQQRAMIAVEYAPKNSLFANPLHPYTRGLLASVPDIKDEIKTLAQIAGQIPDMTKVPTGCAFHPRCPDVTDSCSLIEPEMLEWEEGHFVKCSKYCV